MSTTLSASPSTQAAIGQAKKTLEMNKHRFETTFSFVPDDKLEFSPGGISKSSLEIAAHVAVSNFTFARLIRRDAPQVTSEADIEAMLAEKTASIKTREQALATLQESTADVYAALDAMTDESFNADLVTPFFTAPMVFWMYLPARHLDNHAAQIDYIQTIWGDAAWHMG